MQYKSAVDCGKTPKKEKIHTWPKVRRVLFLVSFCIIPVLNFLVFYVYVNFDSILMAFSNIDHGNIEFVGFSNFKWIFNQIKLSVEMADIIDPRYNLVVAIKNTFITFGVTILLFPVGMFVSYFIYKKILFFRMFRVLFYLPSILSTIVISFFYVQLNSAGTFFSQAFGKIVGVSEDLLNKFSPISDSRYANIVVLLQVIWMGIPSNLILWGGAFSRIPYAIIESAKLDGVSWIREMFSIILPCVWPTFVLLITTIIAGIFGATGNVFLLTDGMYNTQTLSNWIYIKVMSVGANPTNASQLYYVSALGLMMTTISCGIAFLVRHFVANKVEEVEY